MTDKPVLTISLLCSVLAITISYTSRPSPPPADAGTRWVEKDAVLPAVIVVRQ